MRWCFRVFPAMAAFALCLAPAAPGEANAAEATAEKNAVAFEPKVVIVTFDGVRWQEIFRGADPALIEAEVEADLQEPITESFVKVADRAGAIAPFLHEVVGKQGVLIGDRDRNSCARVKNDMWFSYPGYTELLAGKPNPALLENDPIFNPDVTVLEWANKDRAFAGKVEMVGTWTLFPFIVNDRRSGVPVNAAFAGRAPTDVMTARAGMQLLQEKKPRLLYIAFGDTDELAHIGDYDGYVSAIERGDEYLRLLWERLQGDPYYRGQTTLIVSTDHGRGRQPQESWRDHSSPRYHALYPDYQPQYNGTGVIGADEIWVAAIGPAVAPYKAKNYTPENCGLQASIAASAVVALGRDAKSFSADAEAPFSFIVSPKP